MGRVSDAKERLLAAALRLIFESNYGSVSVDAICDRAGVRKGSFYHFFASKSELAAEAVEADFQSRRPQLDAIFAATVPPMERFERYFAYIKGRQERFKKEFGKVLGCTYFTLGSELSTVDEKVRLKVEELIERIHSYYETAIRDAQVAGILQPGDPRVKARTLFSYIRGTLTQARIENNLEMVYGLGPNALLLLGLTSVERGIQPARSRPEHGRTKSPAAPTPVAHKTKARAKTTVSRTGTKSLKSSVTKQPAKALAAPLN